MADVLVTLRSPGRIAIRLARVRHRCRTEARFGGARGRGTDGSERRCLARGAAADRRASSSRPRVARSTTTSTRPTRRSSASRPTPRRPTSSGPSPRRGGPSTRPSGRATSSCASGAFVSCTRRWSITRTSWPTSPSPRSGAPRMLMGGPQLGEPIKFLPFFADLAESYEWHPAARRRRHDGRAEQPVGRARAGRGGRARSRRGTTRTRSTSPRSRRPSPPGAPSCSSRRRTRRGPALALGRLVAEHTDIPAGRAQRRDRRRQDDRRGADHQPGRRHGQLHRLDRGRSADHGGRCRPPSSGSSSSSAASRPRSSSTTSTTSARRRSRAVFGICTHGGQGCATSTRLLLPRSRYDEGVEAAAAMIAGMLLRRPRGPGAT